MALDKNTLRSYISEKIQSNGRGNITGQILQTVLLNIVDTLEQEITDPKPQPPQKPIVFNIEEVTSPPDFTPIEDSLLLDTKNNMVYFGMANNGWWRTDIKPWRGMVVKYLNGILYIEGGCSMVESMLILEDGSVTNNILTL